MISNIYFPVFSGLVKVRFQFLQLATVSFAQLAKMILTFQKGYFSVTVKLLHAKHSLHIFFKMLGLWMKTLLVLFIFGNKVMQSMSNHFNLSEGNLLPSSHSQVYDCICKYLKINIVLYVFILVILCKGVLLLLRGLLPKQNLMQKSPFKPLV